MNRELIIKAILAKAEPYYPEAMTEMAKHLSDTNLLAYAISIGIDTDKILEVK